MLWDDQFLSRRDVVWVEAQSVLVGGDERLRADVKLARNTIHRIAGLHHVFAGAGDWRGRANRLAAAGDDGRSQIGVRRQRGFGRVRRIQAATPHLVRAAVDVPLVRAQQLVHRRHAQDEGAAGQAELRDGFHRHLHVVFGPHRARRTVNFAVHRQLQSVQQLRGLPLVDRHLRGPFGELSPAFVGVGGEQARITPGDQRIRGGADDVGLRGVLIIRLHHFVVDRSAFVHLFHQPQGQQVARVLGQRETGLLLHLLQIHAEGQGLRIGIQPAPEEEAALRIWRAADERGRDGRGGRLRAATLRGGGCCRDDYHRRDARAYAASRERLAPVAQARGHFAADLPPERQALGAGHERRLAGRLREEPTQPAVAQPGAGEQEYEAGEADQSDAHEEGEKVVDGIGDLFHGGLAISLFKLDSERKQGLRRAVDQGPGPEQAVQRPNLWPSLAQLRGSPRNPRREWLRQAIRALPVLQQGLGN